MKLTPNSIQLNVFYTMGHSSVSTLFYPVQLIFFDYLLLGAVYNLCASFLWPTSYRQAHSSFQQHALEFQLAGVLDPADYVVQIN